MIKVKNSLKKLVSIILLFVMLFSMLGAFTNISKADSYRYTYDGYNLDTNAFPGFKERLDAIKAAHPNWNIIIMDTGLDWNQVILAESSITGGGSPYSLIQGKSGAWICSTCGSRSYDNGSWYHASEATIRYYMDPRNWMDPNSSTILQFLQTGWIETSNDDVYNAIKGTFLDWDGLGWENAVAINNASRNNNANPLYVVARILQEQGVNGSGTYRMYSDGVYYYNIFNIGATGNGSGNIIANALAKAKAKGWDTLEKSIAGGIQFLYAEYINQKQNTIYLNKFDVEDYGGLYSHQYMQNIEAPKSEASILYSKIKDTGLLNQGLTFVIPLYRNMPVAASASPATMGETRPKNIRVKAGHSDINVREARNTSSRIITTIKNSDVIVLSVERYGDGWHKIVLVDGTVGYIYFDTKYFEEIDDITNCSESVIVVGNDVNLRSGPGSSQAIITTLTYGQQMTRIDNSGRYNIEGMIWDRVKLSDGTQGFVSRNYLQLSVDSNNIFTIKADGGLYLRETPAGNAIRLLLDGTQVTRTEIGTEQINGYYWDKVTTPDGAIGYVARSYLRDKNGSPAEGNVVQPQAPEVPKEPLLKTEKNDESKTVKAEPDVSVESLKSEYGENLTITKPDGTPVENGIVGTGYKIKINDTEYTIIKLGDVNGTGTVDILDMAHIQRDLTDYQKLENEYKEAAKISSKGGEEINIIDMALIRRYLTGTQDIKLK